MFRGFAFPEAKGAETLQRQHSLFEEPLFELVKVRDSKVLKNSESLLHPPEGEVFCYQLPSFEHLPAGCTTKERSRAQAWAEISSL